MGRQLSLFGDTLLEGEVKAQHVAFVDEVEEFNALMNKPNNYEPTIPEKKRVGICLQLCT